MSYKENSILVSFTSHLLITGYFLINIFDMIQNGDLIGSRVFSLWGVVIVVMIVVNILGNILTNIIRSIAHAIRTRSDKPERFVEDERDKLIELKGIQISYIIFSAGVLIAMLSFVFGNPPLVMFSAIIFSSFCAEIIGDIFQLIQHRRGF